MKPEREFKMRFRVAAVRVDMRLLEDQHRSGLEQLASLLGEDVAVSSHFRERPVRAALIDAATRIGRRRIVHVMEHEAPADGFAVSVSWDVVDLPHFD